MPPAHKQTATGAATVAPGHKWIPITPDLPPVGSKVLLINRWAGHAVTSIYAPGYWSHWYPLPTFEPIDFESNP